MNKKLFQIVDRIITSLEKDKILLLSLLIVFIGMIIILIGLSKARAGYIHIAPTHKVWGYTWGKYADKLYKKMKDIGYTDYHAKLIINKCKRYTQDVGNCVIAIASIGKAESGAFKHCKHNNCLGIAKGKYGYKSISESLDDWISKYNKYWYTWRWKGGARFFYSLNGRPSISRYCISEMSSGMKKFNCPNGYSNFKKAFYYLTK